MIKNKKIILGITVAVLIGGSILWSAKSGHKPAAGEKIAIGDDSKRFSAPDWRDTFLRGRKGDVYYCPMHPTYTSDRPGDCPICNMKLVKKENLPTADPKKQAADQLKDICIMHNCAKAHGGKPCRMLMVGKEGEIMDCPVCGKHVLEQGKVKKILYWTDPMIPGYKSDKPGKSPMGMDLIAVYEEENPQVQTTATEGYAQVMLSPQKRQLIGLKTAPVSRKDINKTIRAAGVIANDPQWYQAQGEFIESVKQFARAKESGNQEAMDEARRFVDSSKVRLKSIGLNDELIDEITTWKEADQSLLYASTDKPVWVYAQIYEYELPYIKVGQSLNVEVPSLPNQAFSGRIRGIDTIVNPETRTTRVRAQIENPQGRLRLGMYINALVHVEAGEVLAVPVEAVFDTGKRQIVFIDKGEGILEPRDVKLGSRGEDFYEVQSGLKEGEMVVTSGNFLVDSESRLKASLEGMTDGGGHQHGQ